MEPDPEYGIGVQTDLLFDEVVTRARVVLRAHGFSILSEMPAPPGRGRESGRRHLFMAVWERLVSRGNLGGPGLDVGDHLPCHVVVFEDGPMTTVAALDPTEGVQDWADGRREAEAAKDALSAALGRLGAAGGSGLVVPQV